MAAAQPPVASTSRDRFRSSRLRPQFASSSRDSASVKARSVNCTSDSLSSSRSRCRLMGGSCREMSTNRIPSGGQRSSSASQSSESPWSSSCRSSSTRTTGVSRPRAISYSTLMSGVSGNSKSRKTSGPSPMLRALNKDLHNRGARPSARSSDSQATRPARSLSRVQSATARVLPVPAGPVTKVISRWVAWSKRSVSRGRRMKSSERTGTRARESNKRRTAISLMDTASHSLQLRPGAIVAEAHPS